MGILKRIKQSLLATKSVFEISSSKLAPLLCPSQGQG